MHSIVRRTIGSKKVKMIFSEDTKAGLSTKIVTLNQKTQMYLVSRIRILSSYLITRYQLNHIINVLWILSGERMVLMEKFIYSKQGRKTVKSQNKNITETFTLKDKGKAIVAGRAVTQKIGVGPVRIVSDPSEMHTVQPGDVLVAGMTDPNWEPVMKRASALVTNRGGRTCHAAIIARELGIPAIVGSVNATKLLNNGDLVTVSCSEGETGIVYQGELKYDITTQDDGKLNKPPVKLMMNVGNPDMAFTFAQTPNHGVGLARLEFVINNMIGIHPKAILNYNAMPEDIQKAIDYRSKGYKNPKDFYISKITEGVATIASAFYPSSCNTQNFRLQIK